MNVTLKKPYIPISLEISPIIRELLLRTENVKNWFGLGMLLHVSRRKLQMIRQKDHRDLERAKIQLFKRWIENNIDVSWIKLAKSLEHLGELIAAEDILKEWNSGMLSTFNVLLNEEVEFEFKYLLWTLATFLCSCIALLMVFTFLPAHASEQGNVIGLVSVYCVQKKCN